MTEQALIDQAVKVINNKEGKYLTFNLAGEEYGLGILKVKEIIGMMPITVVPQTPPYSYGMVVTTTGEKLYIGMSSSSGREVDQIMAYYDTSASALTALGLPAGATITKVEWRIFNCGYSGSYATFTMFLFGSKTEALGTTITLGDWDFPGCTSFGAQGVSYTWSLGWKVFDITSMGINTTGYTNMGLKPGWCKTEAGTAMFEASESTNGNVPVIRIYYSVTITPPPVVGGVTLPLMGVG